MPRPALRSRKLRRRRVHSPGGSLRLRYDKKMVSTSKCGSCGKSLSGVPRKRETQLSKLSKTARRPTRPFGGYYCSPCTRLRMKEKAFSLTAK